MGSSNWLQTAECRDMDPEIFFPKRGQSLDPRADQACDKCPAFTSGECLDDALANYVQGRWAKTSPRDRAKMRRDIKKALERENTPVKIVAKKKKTA